MDEEGNDKYIRISRTELTTEVVTNEYTYSTFGTYKNTFINGTRAHGRSQGGAVLANGEPLNKIRDDEKNAWYYAYSDIRQYTMGTKVTLTCEPAPGYVLVKMTVDGEEVDPSSGYDLDMMESHQIKAYFEHPISQVISDSLSISSYNFDAVANKELVADTSVLRRGLEGWTWLEVNSMNSPSVDADLTDLLESNEILVYNYYTFDYYKQYDYLGKGGYEKTHVGKSAENVLFGIEIPEEIRNNDPGNERTFYFISAKEGAPKIMSEGTGDTLLVEWNESGTYLLGYKDEPASTSDDTAGHAVQVIKVTDNRTVLIDKGKAAAGETVI